MYYSDEQIDIGRLRRELINYFGTAASVMPLAMGDLIAVENASDSELIQIAINNGFDLKNYINEPYTRSR